MLASLAVPSAAALAVLESAAAPEAGVTATAAAWWEAGGCLRFLLSGFLLMAEAAGAADASGAAEAADAASMAATTPSSPTSGTSQSSSSSCAAADEAPALVGFLLSAFFRLGFLGLAAAAAGAVASTLLSAVCDGGLGSHGAGASTTSIVGVTVERALDVVARVGARCRASALSQQSRRPPASLARLTARRGALRATDPPMMKAFSLHASPHFLRPVLQAHPNTPP